jgi:hypothetical protein
MLLSSAPSGAALTGIANCCAVNCSLVDCCIFGRDVIADIIACDVV